MTTRLACVWGIAFAAFGGIPGAQFLGASKPMTIPAPSYSKRLLPANDPRVLREVAAERAMREAQVYTRGGRTQLADAMFRKALQESPWPMYAETYGRFLEKEGRPNDALKQYMTAIAPEKGYSLHNNLDLLVHVAELADRTGNPLRNELYHRIVSAGRTVAPQFPSVSVSPGASLVQLRSAVKVVVAIELLRKDDDAAIACLNKAISIDGSNALAHFYLALAHWQDGRDLLARESYTVSRNMAGDNQELVAALAWIEKIYILENAFPSELG